jgi:sulfatase modifying factor 1
MLSKLLLGLLLSTGCLIGTAEEQSQRDGSPKVVQNSIGMQLVKIPAGEFLMGGHERAEELCAAFPEMARKPEYFENEYPQHRVRISRDFLVGKYEVTVGQFRQFTNATGYRTQAETDGLGGWGYVPTTGKCVGRRPQFTWRDPGFSQSDEHPVVNVTWNDAVAFCNWLSKQEGKRYRLPSEAEWEYVCRAGTSARFFHGNDPEELRKYAHLVNIAGKDKFANVQDQVHVLKDGESLTAKVGSRLPNAWGLHDTLGNVWEWVNDWQSDDYYARSPAVDPTGPGEAISRGRRGGGWNSFPIYTRPAFRNLDDPQTRCLNIGFRVVCDE